MNLKLHNLILTIGPSMCGKSTWAEKLKAEIKRKYKALNVQIVSSDAIRRVLLDSELDRYDDRMMQVSGPAFALLEDTAKALMSWPVNAEIIIVDTTGLSQDFRKKMVDLADYKAYNSTALVFNYPNREDYLQFGGGEVTQRHINRMKYVWRDLNIFTDTIQVTSPIAKIDVEIEDYNYYRSHFTDNEDFIVVGDVHGQNEALEKLPLKRKIYVGDIVDKAPAEDVKAVIDWVYKEVKTGFSRFVIGNHDVWCVRYWEGSKSHTQDIAEKYFQSALDLDDESRLKLTELVNVYGRDFIRTPHYIITHAPCRLKYLGKLHTGKQQQMIRLPRQDDYTNQMDWRKDLYNRFDFLRAEEDRTLPMHIWGHVSLNRPFRNQSNLGICVGAYTGNGLAYYSMEDRRYYFVDSINKCDADLLDTLVSSTNQVALENLDGRTKGRVLWMARNKVNFISGTISPADRSGDDLESLDWAFKYYLEKYGSVVIQPKYMGSRAQIYLHENPSESYMITRNGYRWEDKDNLLLPEYERLAAMFESEFKRGLAIRILDAEVLPWRLLGEGLIEKSFFAYGNILRDQSYELTKTLNSPINKWTEYFADLTVDRDGETIPIAKARKQEVIKQHGHHIWTTYQAYQDLVFPNPDDVSMFLHQVALYGDDGPVLIKPFAILKDVYKNGQEELYLGSDTKSMWEKINPDQILVTSNLTEARNFYIMLTKVDELEGVVLKAPKQVCDGNMAAVKVRNPEYLRMVYGPDYLTSNKYSKLLDRKRIASKVKASIVEWERGWEMLKVPYVELAEDNEWLVQLYINHVNEDFGPIDPRL